MNDENEKMNDEKLSVDSAMPKDQMYRNSTQENAQFEEKLPRDRHRDEKDSEGTNMKGFDTKLSVDKNIKLEDMTSVLEKMSKEMDRLTLPFNPESGESYYEETSGKTPEEAIQYVVKYLNLNKDKEKVLFERLNCMNIDTILVLKVKDTWIPPQNVTSDSVLDFIATWQTLPNVRRDNWPGAERWLFHFRNVCEIARCREEMFSTHPFCFGVNPELVNHGIIPKLLQQGNIFADAVVVDKIGVRKVDVFQYGFFM